MAKIEPLLEFRLSRPDSFHCSFCGTKPDEGAFVVTGEISDLVAAFKAHVERYHPEGEDFSQTAPRIVGEALGGE
jgi:formylmethanofuran dehydrogenase subunit C